mgnify:FL=1
MKTQIRVADYCGEKVVAICITEPIKPEDVGKYEAAHFTPQEAREIAAELMSTADKADQETGL